MLESGVGLAPPSRLAYSFLVGELASSMCARVAYLCSSVVESFGVMPPSADASFGVATLFQPRVRKGS